MQANYRNFNAKEWRCCLSLLHVRTATILIGLYHLMLNLLAIMLLAVIIKNPTIMHDANQDTTTPDLDDSSEEDYTVQMLPTPQSKVDTMMNTKPYSDAFRDHALNYQDIDMGGLVCLCMLAITLMLIYGTVKGKPAHMLPFFFLQLCDFAITTLTAAGYICYLRTVHTLISDSTRMPWREELLKMNPRTLGISVLFAFIIMVMIKAYAIGIVWRCYKFLTLRQHAQQNFLAFTIPTTQPERSYNSLLPDYDEAINQSMKQAPPPSYQMAMQQHINLQLQAATDTPRNAETINEVSVLGESSTPELTPASNEANTNNSVSEVEVDTPNTVPNITRAEEV